MSDPTSTTPSIAPDWDDCPEGLLRDCGQRRYAEHRRAVTARYAAGGAATVAALAIAVMLAPAGPGDPTGPAAITCAQCVAGFETYAAHLTDPAAAPAPGVTADDFESMQAHLASCPKCRAAFSNRYPDLAPAVTATAAAALLAFAWRRPVAWRRRG